MTSMRTLRVVAAAVLGAAALTVLPGAPATAATCSSATGVSVVVDFSLLGGSVAATCVTDGGGDSAGAILEVDHDLTRIAQFPGAVCKVDGTPADAQCQRMPPADAYWGLFWSDGSGGWVYSSEGVDGLTIPDGGSVAFAWQDGGDRDQPGIAPPQHASADPSPSPSPDGGGNDAGDHGDGDGGQPGQPGQGASSPPPSASPSGAASPTEGPGQEGDGTHGRPGTGGRPGQGGQNRPGDGVGTDPSDSPTPEADPSDAVPASAEPPAGSGAGGLPAWVAPVGVAGLFGVAGVVALLRRRSTVR